jgi:hypothetical protein
MLGLYKILIPKMFGADFSVLINCEFFVISSSYTKNPQLPFFWVNGKSMKCDCSIPRTAAIGAAVRNTTMMTHTERKKDTNQDIITVLFDVIKHYAMIAKSV